MAEKTLLQKLRLQPGQRALILNAPAGYLEGLGALPAGVALDVEPQGSYDFVHLFVRNAAELARLRPAALAAIKDDGILWIAYPKGSSKVATDINRDSLWALMGDSGLRPVMQIAMDAIWSALRFRPAEKVGK